MGIIEATKTCFRKYITTSGRASRSEYWWFILVIILVSLVAMVIDLVIFGADPDGAGGPAGIVWSLGTFIPSITAAIRRLHDTGKPWYYILVPILGVAIGMIFMFSLAGILGGIAGILGGLIMLAGFALQLWWLVKPSDPGTNAFGPNPLNPIAGNVEEVFE